MSNLEFRNKRDRETREKRLRCVKKDTRLRRGYGVAGNVTSEGQFGACNPQPWRRRVAPDSFFGFINAMETQLTFYGHAAFKIVTSRGNVLLIDPWLTNPLNDKGKDEVAALKRVDLILLTHGHSDHVGDTVEIAKRTGAKLVATLELSEAMKAVHGYPADKADTETTGHIGGKLKLLDGDVTVTFAPALHGSGVVEDGKPPYYGGSPTGLVVAVANGPTIYHTGDTDLFSDMELISRYHKIDVMIPCIGDHFTMGPERAADAVQLVKPRMVIPSHYSTFPVLTGTPEIFERELKKREAKTELRVMKVGEAITL
jgi:L-ascorbate metabolism protein UlaG (beta-lactamase superfamily)